MSHTTSVNKKKKIQMFPTSVKRELYDCWGCQVCTACFTFMKEYSGFGSSTDWMAVFSFFLAGPCFLPTRFCSSGPIQEKISKDFQVAITVHRAVVLMFKMLIQWILRLEQNNFLYSTKYVSSLYSQKSTLFSDPHNNNLCLSCRK